MVQSATNCESVELYVNKEPRKYATEHFNMLLCNGVSVGSRNLREVQEVGSVATRVLELAVCSESSES